MGEMYGIALEYIIGGAVAIVLIVVSALVVRARRQRQLAEDAMPKLTPETRPDSPSRDVLADRRTIAGPVEIDDSMSLKEVRELKRARLDSDYKDSDSSQQAKEWRKGAQEVAQSTDTSAPAERRVPAPVAPSTDVLVVPEADSAIEQPEESTKTPQGPVQSRAVAEETPKSLADGLAKTRTGFLGRIGSIFSGRAELDEDLLEDVEEVLFTADIGARVSQQLLMAIETRVSALDSQDPEIVWAVLREEVESILDSNDGKFEYDASADPFVVLVVGVNGAGKTTTIGKLAARYQREGKKVLMIAGDTFRAAAVEQLEAWADRVGCGFHRGESEADPSSVIYDGIERAQREGFDLVLCDTAGRLHTRAPLVDELKKIHRVCGKAHDGAPHETLLVLDANTGQNAIQQAKLFGEAVDVTGIVLTKLDGTAKGGVILGICKDLGVPVHFIGIGEGVRDLRPFDGREFVEALFA